MGRLFELTTPLGKDVLRFRAMRGQEELGRVSEFELSALSTRPDIAPGDLLGRNVTVRIELRTGQHRYLNGYVCRFAPDAMVGRYYQYQMTIHPWLWFLTRSADCRIFQERTVPEILKEVFAAYPEAEFEDHLGGHVRREYCVQYRETDFNFVSRLMEEEGIYYYFDHQDGRHVLKLVDATSAHTALEGKESIAFRLPGTQTRLDDEFIHAWTFTQSIQPGHMALTDYDFRKPKVNLGVKARLLQPHDRADREIFDYPGEYREINDGERYARTRIDEFHAGFDRADADCNVREVAVGRVFNLINAPRRDQERQYLIVAARYDWRDNAYETSAEAPASYHCSFTALHTRQQFRPERITPEPRVVGPQTAVVVTPHSEEIWCDEYGRVKVQFHWDRYGQRDENASCWLRVAQPWAGASWGAIFLPRRGQEVLVDFLEGDPDQPVIIGSLYNADQMPPYGLPASKTQSGIKTRSSPGGGPTHFNEIRFEDRKGREQLYIHAERTLTTVVEGNESRSVGGSRTTTIQQNDTLTIKDGNREETLDQGNDTLLITTGNREQTLVQGNDKLTVSLGNVDVTAPSGTYSLVAQKVHITGLVEVSIVCGASVIRMTPASLTITSPIVKLNC